MNKELLLDVVRALESVPEEKFDMEFWINSCKTVGCAIGHYCLAHPDADIFLKNINVSGSCVPLHDLALQSRSSYRAFDAVSEYFHISDKEAHYLFDPDSYRADCSKSEVIGRILKFVGVEAVGYEQRTTVGCGPGGRGSSGEAVQHGVLV